MNKLKFVTYAFLISSVINFCAVFAAQSAETDCFEGTQYADVRAQLKEAVDHPEYFKEIINADDQKSISEILRKILDVINEGDDKIKKGDLLVEEYKKEYQEFQEIYKIKESLEDKLKQDYQKLTYSDITKIRGEIASKNQELELKSNNYNKKIERISVISKDLKSNTDSIKNFKKEFRAKIREVKLKQQGLLNEESLLKRLGGTDCYD